MGLFDISLLLLTTNGYFAAIAGVAQLLPRTEIATSPGWGFC